MPRFLRYHLPALLWAGIILATSNGYFSSDHTGGLLLWLHIPDRWLDLVNFIFRKCAHLGGYGVLGALNFRALRADKGGWRAGWAVGAVALAVAVASIDEWHQSYIPSRTGNAQDVLVDGIGATIAQLIIRVTGRRAA